MHLDMFQLVLNLKKKGSQILKEKGITALILKPLSGLKQIFFVLYTRLKITKLTKNYSLNSLINYSFGVNNV